MPYYNREFSGRLVKFFLSLIEVNNANHLVGISFFRLDDEEFEERVTQYEIRNIPDFATIAKSIVSWKAILRGLSNSISRSRELPEDIEDWLNEEDANRGPVREAMRAFDDAEAADERAVIPGVKEIARRLLRTEDFIQIKSNVAQNLKIYKEEYERARNLVEDIADLVNLGSVSKPEGSRRCAEVLNALDRVVEASRQLFILLPEQEVEDLIVILIGPMRNANHFQELIEILHREEYRNAVNYMDPHVRSRNDIPWLEEEFRLVKVHVTEFKKSVRQEEAEEVAIARTLQNVREDVQSLLESIYGERTDLNEMDSGELQFFKEKISGVEKRLNELRNISDRANFRVVVRVHGIDEEVLASEALIRASRDVYRTMAAINERKKDDELRQKIKLQSIERAAPAIQLPDLETAADFIVWMTSYTPLKKSYRTSGMEDWKLRLRDKVKLSLKNSDDIKAVKGLLDLKEVEDYLRQTYIKSCSIIHDVLSPLTKMKRPKTIKESIENIQITMKLVNLVKKRRLMEKMTEQHTDTIINVTLLKTDYREYVRLWSEKLRKEMRRSSTRVGDFGSDTESDDSEDSESGADLEASVAEEVSCDTLARRKKFLFKFLKEKLGQLKIQTAMDIRSGKDDQDSKSGKNNWNSKYEKRKVTFEKALVVNETESDSEQIYSVGEEKAKRYEERIVMKPCLLKCDRRVHKNGCLFACGTFRKASVDERNEICKRNFVCILCLRRKGKPHSCHYKKPCNHCKGAHNTLLCKKLLSDQEQALQAEEDEETDIEDESVNHESVFLACEKDRKMKSARQRPIEKSADEKAYKVNESESGDDSEFCEVVGRVMDYSSLDSDSEVDDPVVLMAITEKRKELIRNMESEYGKMDILGSMPKGFGEEYIKNEIKQNLQEAEDDISRANKFDTAKRKFGERGNLWRNILNEASKTEKTVEVVKAETRGFPRLFPGAGEINGKQAKSEEAEANDEEESVALVSDMPDTNFEIKFLKKEN